MELTDYFKSLRSHWLSVLLFAVSGVLVAFGWTLIQPRVYSADASGIISVGVSQDLGSAMAGESYAKSRVKSYLDLAKSRAVAESAINDLHLAGVSPDALISRISVQNPLDTATLKITAQASSPGAARDLAEAWVRAVGKQVDSIESGGPGAKEKSIVVFRSLDSALLPTSPSSPNVKVALIVGLVSGLVGAVIYLLLRTTLDRRVRSASGVEAATGQPVIGTVPFNKNLDADSRIITSLGGNDVENQHHHDYAVAESMRELRTNLQFMDVDNPPRAIVVTSALPGEGKTTVTSNLAQAIASSGQRVIIVDGDLRRPMVAKTFGLVATVGLTDVLIGRADVEDVLQPWGESGNLTILGAGSIPPNPSELLGSRAMGALLNELRKEAVVLVDAPPLLPVTDAAILSTQTDGVLLVARAGKSKYEELNRALQNLKRVNGRALGVIINGMSRKSTRGDGYDYQYYTYYNRKSTGEPRSSRLELADSVPVTPDSDSAQTGRRVRT